MATHNEMIAAYTNAYGSCLMVRVGDEFEVVAFAMEATEQGMQKRVVYKATGIEDKAQARKMFDDVVEGMKEE
jgi:hypothetical protein